MIDEDFVSITNDVGTNSNGTSMFSLDELKKRIGERLGKGAFGVVHAVKDHPRLAVKEIRIDGMDKKLIEITEFELKTMSQFSHPGVLRYHQIIRSNDFIFIVMDRYSSDLDKFITDHKKDSEPIPRELMLSILRQLVNALAYLHNFRKVDVNGNTLPAVVHRDLKPANVLISRDGERVVIADFGLCKDAAQSGKTFAGTPVYMAPRLLYIVKLALPLMSGLLVLLCMSSLL